MQRPAHINTASVIKCPNCNSLDTERIPSNKTLKALLPFLHAKHYVCYKCMKKFYKTSFKQSLKV
jgi:DNA-directed RNA polymerase subunit RPC12/RpoP